MEVYTELASQPRNVLPLLDEHREQLKVKRGFTDETIEKLGFFSAGHVLVDYLKSIVGRYGVSAMTRAGLYTSKTCPATVAKTWTNDDIVIPFWRGSECVYLRCHKMGPSEVPVQLYLPAREVPTGCDLVVCESEYKAAAAHQIGYPAIGLCGIWSHSRKNIDDFTNAIKKANPRTVYVLFDNEDVANPAYKNHKKDPLKRYEAQSAAYIMACMLEKVGVDTKIAWFPDSWRVDGKADVDGCVAAGKTFEDFKVEVFDHAREPELFFAGQTEESQAVISARHESMTMATKILNLGGKVFYQIRNKDGILHHVPLSNFQVEIDAVYDDPDGCQRAMRLIRNGKASRPFVISPDYISSAGKFHTFVSGCGPYIWKGSDKHLKEYLEVLYTRHGDRVIYRPDHVGLIRKADLWLFHNCAIQTSGSMIRPDAEGIFYVDLDHGYSCRPLEDGGKHGGRMSAPEINLAIPCTDVRKDLREISDMMCVTMGSLAPAIGLGWVVGSLYLDDLFPIDRHYPILFVFGKRRGGKTTLCRWLNQIVGVETNGISMRGTTLVGLTRALSYLSSMPTWVDEYRNTKESAAMQEHMRGIYNHSVSVKGVKSAFGAKSYEVRGTLMLSGEEAPSDNAMQTRCVILPIHELDWSTPEGRKRSRFNEIVGTSNQWSRVVPQLIARRVEFVSAIKQSAADLFDAMREKGINDRTARHWSLVLAVYIVCVDCDEAHEDKLLGYVCERAQEAHRTGDEEHASSQYLQDLAVMSRNKLLLCPPGDNVDYERREGELRIRSADTYQKWVQYRHSMRLDPWAFHAIEQAMYGTPGYLGHHRRRIGASRANCFVFDSNCPELPEAMKDLAGLNVEAGA